MRKFILILIVPILFACTSETPWRKVSVETYELLGIGIKSSQDIALSLKASGVITDEQLAKIKVTYNQARAVYIKAGETLKLAGQVASSAERDKLLAEYSTLLANFKNLAQQVYDMIKNFKKITYLEVEHLIATGGEIWLQ